MKTQSQSAGPPGGPKPEALEEKITHLTEDFAKTANRFKVPALVALVLIVAIIAISSLVSYLGEQQEGDWSEKIYLVFQGEPAQIRVDAPKLLDQLEGKRIEPALVTRYARWLFEQDEPGDRDRAVALIEEAKGRHPDSLLLGLAYDEFTLVQQMSEGFELPPIPEPEPLTPAPGTGLPPSPLPVPGTGAAPTPPAGEGDTAPEGTEGGDSAPEGSGATGEAGASGETETADPAKPVLSDETGTPPPAPPIPGDDFDATSPDGSPAPPPTSEEGAAGDGRRR